MSQGKTTQRKSHPVRLAILMLGGMFVGAALAPPVGSVFDIWGFGLLIGGTLGMTAGLAVELCLQRIIAHEVVVGIAFCIAFGILWAISLHREPFNAEFRDPSGTQEIPFEEVRKQAHFENAPSPSSPLNAKLPARQAGVATAPTPVPLAPQGR